MGVQDLRKLLENAEDKLSIFQDKEQLSQYDMSIAEFLELVRDFLEDEQKAQLLETVHIKKLSAHIKKSIINDVIDDNIRLDLIRNDDIISDLDEWQVRGLVESLGENGKIQILQDSSFFEKHEMKDYEIIKIISSLSDENKVSLLSNRDLLEKQLKLKDYTIKDIVASLEDEQVKLNMSDIYGFKSYMAKDIIKTFSYNGMKEVLLENKYDFNDYDITYLVTSMDTDSLIDFISNHKEFLTQNNVSPYLIIKKIGSEKQLEFMAKFEDAGLTIRREKTNFSNFR